MADQVEVFVKNVITQDVDIRVERKLPDGSSDLDKTIAKGNEEKIYLGGTDVSLVIHAPTGWDTKKCWFENLKTEIDLKVVCRRSKSTWTIQIEPNDLPPDTPLTANVPIGGDGP